jgi:hypothetical protein
MSAMIRTSGISPGRVAEAREMRYWRPTQARVAIIGGRKLRRLALMDESSIAECGDHLGRGMGRAESCTIFSQNCI